MGINLTMAMWERWRILTMVCLMVCLVGLAGCSKTISSEWREEVRLGDGLIAVIRREMTVETGKAMTGNRYYFHTKRNIYYFPPATKGGKEVAFEGSTRPTWQLMLVDRDPSTGHWRLVDTTGECIYSKKANLYYQRNFVDGVWVQQPAVSAELFGRDRNVRTNERESMPAQGALVKVEEKDAALAESKDWAKRNRKANSSDVVFAGEVNQCNGKFIE